MAHTAPGLLGLTQQPERPANQAERSVHCERAMHDFVERQMLLRCGKTLLPRVVAIVFGAVHVAVGTLRSVRCRKCVCAARAECVGL